MTPITIPAPHPAMVLAPAVYDGEETEAGSPLRQLGNVLRRRWRLVLACAAATALLAGLAGLMLGPAYTARAQILITPPQAPAKAPGLIRADETAVAVETEVSVIGSRDQINRTLDRLLLHPDFPAATFAPEGLVHRIARAAASAAETGPASGWLRPWLEALLAPEQAASLQALAAEPNPSLLRERMVDVIERNLKVAAEPRSRVVSVRYVARRAALAALVANTTVEAYLDDQQERKRAGIRRDLARYEVQIPLLRQEVEAAFAATRSFRNAHELVDLAAIEQQEREVIVLKGKLNGLQVARAALDADEAALRKLRAGSHEAALTARVEPRLVALQEQEQRLLAEGARPDGAAPADRAALRRQIVAEIDLALGRLAEDRALADQRMQAFQRHLATVETELQDVRPAAETLRELQWIADVKRQLYESERLAQQTLLQNQDRVEPEAVVLSAAVPPQNPSSASPILFLPPALVVGLLLGGGLAVWREGQDATLRNQRTLPATLGIAAVGFLPAPPAGPAARRRPRAPARASIPGPVPARGTLGHAALRAIFLATCPFEADRPGRRIVLVTSSVAGEHGAALAEALAAYAAGLLPRVLLVDLHRRPQGERHEGAQDGVREGPAGDPEDAAAGPIPDTLLARSGSAAGLEVLSPVRPVEDPMAFLAARSVAQHLRRLRGQYDCIVVHAGPILGSGEAQMLAGEADRILLAIRWGRTPRHVVQNALAQLAAGGAVKAGHVGAVLTRVEIRRHLAYRFGDAIEAMAAGHLRPFA